MPLCGRSVAGQSAKTSKRTQTPGAVFLPETVRGPGPEQRRLVVRADCSAFHRCQAAQQRHDAAHEEVRILQG